MAYIGNSPANVGNFQVVDDISSTFNGTLTSFALTALTLPINPAKSGQLLVSINGVLQEPDDTGTEGFKVSGSNIVFSSAPATGSTFWAVWQGQAVDIGTPSDNTVGNAQVADNALSGNKIDGGTISNFTSTGIDDNATSTAITIDASENVGIGTPSPSLALDVNGRAIIAQSAVGNYEMLTLNQGFAGSASRLRFINSSGGNCDIEAVAGVANTMAFRTNDTERMRIDSAGRVTMPNQPSFSATRLSDTAITTGIKIPFSNVLSNKGNNYVASGRFTAPVSGSYQFNCQVLSAGNYAIMIHLYKNGVSIAKSHQRATASSSSQTSDDYQNGTINMVVPLLANEYVEMWNQNTYGVYFGDNYSQFSGFLIG